MKKKLEGEEGSSSDDELQTNVVDTVELLETAWEVLEYSRLIYSASPEYKLQLAEVHLTIGDLSMESDNMEDAIIDYTQCLELRQSILPPDDRKLAETHYSIGLANEYKGNHREALGHYTMAFKILDTKLHVSSNEDEQAELKAIVEELLAKMEELSKADKPEIERSTPNRPKLESSNIERVDATSAPTLPVKRKAQTLSPSSEQEKKVNKH